MGARPCIRVKEPIGFVLTRPQSLIPRWMMGMGKVPPCLSSPNLQTGKSARKLGLAKDCGRVRVLCALFEYYGSYSNIKCVTRDFHYVMWPRTCFILRIHFFCFGFK